MTSSLPPALTFTDCAPAWRNSYFDDTITPQLVATVYSTAAGVIIQGGYNSYFHDGEQGGPVSMAAALRIAAALTRPKVISLETIHQCAEELEEDCATRLGGFLYMTGQRYSRLPGVAYGAGSDLADTTRLWDDDRGRLVAPTAPGAESAASQPVQLLMAAAAFMMAMAPRG